MGHASPTLRASDSRHDNARVAAAQPSGTVSLVFTDIEGSTRLLHELGTDDYHLALAEHRRVVRAAAAHHAGYEVDCEGDAFFYAFPSAQQAVSAVREAMEGLEGSPTRIRVGIHTGEPRLDPPKYVGLDVHRAARIMAAAHGGQALLSASTAALVERDGMTDLGVHRLKDLRAPEHVFQLGEGRFPPLRTLTEGDVVARRRRRRAVAVLVAIVAALVTAGIVLATGGDQSPLKAVDTGSLGIVDPESGYIVGQVPLGASPRRVGFGAGVLWATNGDEGVSVVNTDSRSLERRVDVGGFAVDVDIADRHAWVLASRPGSLEMVLREVDPQFGVGRGVVHTGANGRAGVDLFGERAERIGVVGSNVWLTNAGATSTSASVVSTGGTLRRISTQSERVEETLSMGRVKELLVDGRSIWVTEIGGVTRMDLIAGTTDRISLPSAAVPNGIASGHGSIWVVTGPLVRGARVIGAGAVTRIDPVTNAVVATIPVGGTPRGVTTTTHGVWVTDRATSRLLRIDPSTNRIAETIDLGNPPEGIVAANDLLWIAVP